VGCFSGLIDFLGLFLRFGKFRAIPKGWGFFRMFLGLYTLGILLGFSWATNFRVW
jgi:hypothetical protein